MQRYIPAPYNMNDMEPDELTLSDVHLNAQHDVIRKRTSKNYHGL